MQPANPIDFGWRAILEAAGAHASDVQVLVRQTHDKESYQIAGEGGKVTIVGSDRVGAMYGELEFAERLRREGPAAWGTHAQGHPFLPERGLNLFLTLPWDYKKNDTDSSVGALTDPSRWWFQNDDYWTTLLDLMAKSRLNWLDIHGAWDISVTSAPNLYAYFVSSPTFPLVGVPADVKAADLARLNKVIAMAHARGIHVSLMAYEANFRIPENPSPPYQGTEANLYKYTREVVEQMIRQAPGLDAIGFRIGESGRSESFFKCYGEAVNRSGRDIPLITRSWITRRQQVLPLARVSKDFTVEIKYNGEQWAAPYPVAGGRMASWNSYSFEDYLSDSGHANQNATTWPGWPASGGGRWPGNPYKIVWQVRANGTHRIFPFYNPDWVRRSIVAMKVGTASGYTVEGEDAYFPKSPDYYLADPHDKYVNWIHQRDELYWMAWGRLGYDPSTPDSAFDARLTDWFGMQGPKIAELWKMASTVVPLAYMAYALGPDHRDHAPELETGGDTQAFIDGNPFDPFVFQPIHETVGFKEIGVRDGRESMRREGNSLNVTAASLRKRVRAVDEAQIPLGGRARFRELEAACGMLAALAEYYGNRMEVAYRAAEGNGEPILGNPGFQVYLGPDVNPWEPGEMPPLDGPPAITSRAWDILSESIVARFYKPFTDRLRMHTNTFHWRSELDFIKRSPGPLMVPLPDGSPLVRPPSPPTGPLVWRRAAGQIEVSLPVGKLPRVWLLWKPLPSPTFFHKIPMSRQGDRFIARIADEPWGECIAAEIESANGITRIPSFFAGEKPYVVVPARNGPTPQIYGCQEAMTYLDPAVLTPGKYGIMLVAPRALDFFRRFDKATKRKLLEPVRRGMTLVILQQDFLSRNYPLDFLPEPLNVGVNPAPDVFDPSEMLGLARLQTSGIQWQRFLPSRNWEISASGGVAHLKYGQGHIYVLAGRLMQTMTKPGVAADLAKVLELNGHKKPVVLVNPGTESSLYTTALYPDLMNALDIPFVTLGEAIADGQRMNSFTPIPGPIMDDEVLGGQGREMADAYLRGLVQRLSARPAPTSAEFETVRAARKRELYRTLGLDPMPPKTPLNARMTGVLRGAGYHIEKVVYESRPRFFVTAHVYVPDGPGPARRPVIVNVNGHWAHKKDEDRIQLRCQFQALQGYIAIAIDSPGFSFEGDSLIERRPEGDHNDYTLVEGGTNATGYYVWDAIRGLDYMAARSDTDMAHVGITGASGGGLATLYTFAADDRYSAAVPVVYMSSLELAPDNGCLCNHVPGTCQIGDRSDVIGIQAPKPVYIMGAQNDGEFTPAGMRLTHDKMGKTWDLFGKGADTYCTIYAGGHDYNQPMREAMIGFFNRYLKGEGDGSPVPQPALNAVNPDDRTLLVLDPPSPGERTMRDLSREYLENAPTDVPLDEVIRTNGGVPQRTPLDYRELGSGPKRAIRFEAQPGLGIAGILVLPAGKVDSVRIVVCDEGKADAQRLVPAKPTEATLYLDVLGIGELSGVEMRYSVYAGTSIPFMDGWQIVRAAEAMHRYSPKISLVGSGPISSQAVMYAGLMDNSFDSILGQRCLRTWTDVFRDGMPDYAVQPRAHLCGSLDHLRSLVRRARWEFAHDPPAN